MHFNKIKITRTRFEFTGASHAILLKTFKTNATLKPISGNMAFKAFDKVAAQHLFFKLKLKFSDTSQKLFQKIFHIN